MTELFPLGTRVRIVGHWGFPDGTAGEIAPIPEFVRTMRENPDDSFLFYEERTKRGPRICQWVNFDQPTDDGSGDGPYSGAGIWVELLRTLEDKPTV